MFNWMYTYLHKFKLKRNLYTNKRYQLRVVGGYIQMDLDSGANIGVVLLLIRLQI